MTNFALKGQGAIPIFFKKEKRTIRWGGGPKNPGKDELREALIELQKDDSEHPDCWLLDEDILPGIIISESRTSGNSL